MHYSSVWKNRHEDDVLECLKEAYDNAGYHVVNFHEIDRAHEKGVDLECKRSEEKIHVQTKMKPGSRDLKQLIRLSKSTANKRIYVHVGQPSILFKNKMENYKDTVEFWDNSKLHDFLLYNRSLKYFRLLYLSSDLIKKHPWDFIHNIFLFSC